MTVSLKRVWGALLIAISMIASAPVFAAVEYMHTDSLGSPAAVTDSDGNLLSTSEYEPFGKLLNAPLTDGPGYTGQVADAATGLSYMQQRYYDPSIGRFLSVDPVTPDGNGGGFNRYAYANDNPYRFADPDGRSPFDVQKKEAAGVVSDAGASAVEGFDPDRSNPGAHRDDKARAYNKSIASQSKFDRRTALAIRAPDYVHISFQYGYVSFGLTYTRNGTLFRGGGGQGTKVVSPLKVKSSLTVGYLNQRTMPSGGTTDNFVRDLTTGPMLFDGIGGGVIYSPSANQSATEFGVGEGFSLSGEVMEPVAKGIGWSK